MISLARYELKYAVPPLVMDSIREFIQPYCVMDEHACARLNGFYTISSLYFDSDDYALHRAAEDNAPVRSKLRVRAYPDAPASAVKFEVKRRVDDVVVKSSATVPNADWTQCMRTRGACAVMPKHAGKALDAFVTASRLFNARPKMLVRYERQAFLGTLDDYARVTFDRRMVYQPMPRYDLAGYPNRWTSIDDAASMGAPCCVVMELKFSNMAPAWMADMVRRFGLVRQGYSKYCCAVRRHFGAAQFYADLHPTSTSPAFGTRNLWIS